MGTQYNKVILSTTMLLGVGRYEMTEVNLDFAKSFAKEAHNYVGHSTVKILGIEPMSTREQCNAYDEALVIKVRGRLEFGREYSVEEIEAIGYDIYHIQKVD